MRSLEAGRAHSALRKDTGTAAQATHNHEDLGDRWPSIQSHSVSEDLDNKPRRSATLLPDMAGFESGTRSRHCI